MAQMTDDDEWGEPQPSKRTKSEKRRRQVVISVRLSADELQTLEAAAVTAGQPLATYLREKALASKAAPTKGPGVRKGYLGEPVNRGGEAAGVVVDSNVRASYAISA